MQHPVSRQKCAPGSSRMLKLYVMLLCCCKALHEHTFLGVEALGWLKPWPLAHLVHILNVGNYQSAAAQPGQDSSALKDAQHIGCNDGRKTVEERIKQAHGIEHPSDVHACRLHEAVPHSFRSSVRPGHSYFQQCPWGMVTNPYTIRAVRRILITAMAWKIGHPEMTVPRM